MLRGGAVEVESTSGRLLCPELELEALTAGSGEGFFELASHFLVDAADTDFPYLRHAGIEKACGWVMEEDFPRSRYARERQEHDLLWRHTILVEFSLRVLSNLDGYQEVMLQEERFLLGGESNGASSAEALTRHFKSCDDCGVLEIRLRASNDVRKLRNCATCRTIGRVVPYCSRECQLAARRTHKVTYGKALAPLVPTPVFSPSSSEAISTPCTPRTLLSVITGIVSRDKCLWVIVTSGGRLSSIFYGLAINDPAAPARDQALATRSPVDVARFFLQLCPTIELAEEPLPEMDEGILAQLGQAFSISEEDLVAELPAMDAIEDRDLWTALTIISQLGGVLSNPTSPPTPRTLTPSIPHARQCHALARTRLHTPSSPYFLFTSPFLDVRPIPLFTYIAPTSDDDTVHLSGENGQKVRNALHIVRYYMAALSDPRKWIYKLLVQLLHSVKQGWSFEGRSEEDIVALWASVAIEAKKERDEGTRWDVGVGRVKSLLFESVCAELEEAFGTEVVRNAVEGGGEVAKQA